MAQQAARNLDVPANPDDWRDEDLVWFLTQFGVDIPGDLIIGDRAMQLSTQLRAELELITHRNIDGAKSFTRR